LRTLLNDELGSLDNLLRVLPTCLNPGGRAAFLTFHSGEDRRVKRHFQEGRRSGIYAAISAEPLRPTPAERRANPRASSAKLRWAIRVSTD
jgi:16S rRNA (cytosine1402-N4)-methyltransferase